MNRAGLAEILGAAGYQKEQVEHVTKLDVFAHHVICNSSHVPATFASTPLRNPRVRLRFPTITLAASMCCCLTRWTARRISKSMAASAPSFRFTNELPLRGKGRSATAYKRCQAGLRWVRGVWLRHDAGLYDRTEQLGLTAEAVAEAARRALAKVR